MDCANNRAIKRVRCDDCRRRYERERSARRRANATRARAIQVYHSKQWAMLRKFVLDPDPICTACGERLSSQVDHILPISEGGTECNPAGRQGICTPCHQAKSAREAAQRARN
jgi:5-methylcytosine-specific restriction enzyme A